MEPEKEDKMTDEEFDKWYDNLINEETADKSEQTEQQKENNKILRDLLKTVGNLGKTVRDKQREFDKLPEQEKKGKVSPEKYAEMYLNLMQLKGMLGGYTNLNKDDES